MIEYLDKTLKSLLSHEDHGVHDARLRDNIQISFAPPGNQFPPSSFEKPALNLFLYELRERKELRGSWENFGRETVTEQGKEVIYQTMPPVWMDCSYLITAWASDASLQYFSDASLDTFMAEHKILTEAMLVFARNEKFPREVLVGSLGGADPDAVIFEAKIVPIKASDVRNIIGDKTKAGIHCMVTMGVSLKEKVKLGPPIEERVFDIHEK